MSAPIKPIEVLLQSGHTVWSLDDLRVLWNAKNPSSLKSQVQYYCEKKRIIRLHRGMYALNKEYNPFELAQKLVRPSYISLETALRKHGILHQHSRTITCIAPYPRSFTIEKLTYQYHQMDYALLSCPLGIQDCGTHLMALPERALCDALYLGFQSDVSLKKDWNTALLTKLVREFSFPRVISGLQQRSLLPA
jgi:hypothetical protein